MADVDADADGVDATNAANNAVTSADVFAAICGATTSQRRDHVATSSADYYDAVCRRHGSSGGGRGGAPASADASALVAAQLHLLAAAAAAAAAAASGPGAHGQRWAEAQLCERHRAAQSAALSSRRCTTTTEEQESVVAATATAAADEMALAAPLILHRLLNISSGSGGGPLGAALSCLEWSLWPNSQPGGVDAPGLYQEPSFVADAEWVAAQWLGT